MSLDSQLHDSIHILSYLVSLTDGWRNSMDTGLPVERVVASWGFKQR